MLWRWKWKKEEMGEKKKIKFKKYMVEFKRHHYDILIPPDTEQLWIINYGNKHWGADWDGNRKGLEALLYSAAVLGFNPADKVIYFPIRRNRVSEIYKKRDAFPGEGSTTVDDCDLVFTTHQAQLKRSEWTEIKKRNPMFSVMTKNGVTSTFIKPVTNGSIPVITGRSLRLKPCRMLHCFMY